MRQFMLMTILSVGAATASSAPSFAESFCIHGRGCVPTTSASYNSCFQLALHRGLTVTVGDKRNLDSFIYQCLAGRIPR